MPVTLAPVRLRSNLRAISHDRDWLAGQHKLPDFDGNPLHPGQQHMIPAADVKDQELSVGTIWCRVDHPAIAGRRHLRTGAGGNGNASFGAAKSIRCTEIAGFDAVDRKFQQSLGRRKWNRRR